MNDDTTRAAHRALVACVLDSEGRASPEERRAAFGNSGLDGPAGALTGKVALHSAGITDEDIAAAIASGLSEDQVFELVVCAAVGQAARQYETALSALAEAAGEADAS